MNEIRDLIVVGGGPVGLYAAIEAALLGLDVAVLEAKPGIIDKACGEGLMPAAVAALERVGITNLRHNPFVGIRYIEGKSHASGRFARGEGWGVRRIELHRALRERADQLGIPVIRHRVVAVAQDRDGVWVDGYRARHVIAADGLRSPLRRSQSLQAAPRHRARRCGITQHFRIAPWTDEVEVHWHELGEAYVTPVAGDEVGVALLFDQRTRRKGEASFDKMLARFPELASRLAGASTCSSLRGAGPFEQRAHRVVDGRILLVGDAAGYLDPITGEGLRLGFAAAIAAVDAIGRDRAADYETAWRHIVRGYWWGTSALLALRRSPLRSLMMPALVRVPGLFDRILKRLGGVSDGIGAPPASVIACGTKRRSSRATPFPSSS